MDDISTTGAVALAAKEDGQLSYQDFLLGCGLAIAGNLMISVSLNVQKYTHKKNDSREVERHYTQDPLWWLGLFLMVFGEVGNFSAYGFAPASLVAPLGTTTVVANLFLAAIFLKESIKPEHLFGSFLAVVGAVLLVFFLPGDKVLNGQQITSSLSEVSFIVYVCIELIILTVLFVLLYKFQVKHAIVYLLITTTPRTILQDRVQSYISFGTNPSLHIEASELFFKHRPQPDSSSQIQAMDSARALVASVGSPYIGCFAYCQRYSSWETDKTHTRELYRNLGLAAACVFVVTFILIAHIGTSVLVFLLLGFHGYQLCRLDVSLGLTIDTVTSVILILAIGLAVDYSAHIGHHFMTVAGSRDERTLTTLREMGLPVFNGGFSTVLAFILC
ncbi:hypothetical protein ScPMuIL_007037 [Solemya velum]